MSLFRTAVSLFFLFPWSIMVITFGFKFMINPITIANLQLDLLFFVELSPSAKLAVKQLVLMMIFYENHHDVIK